MGRRVTLIGRAGCHLCEQAESVVSGVVEAAVAAGAGATLERLDVDGDLGGLSANRAEWSELVPVVLVDEKVFAVIRVDPNRLRAELLRS